MFISKKKLEALVAKVYKVEHALNDVVSGIKTCGECGDLFFYRQPDRAERDACIERAWDNYRQTAEGIRERPKTDTSYELFGAQEDRDRAILLCPPSIEITHCRHCDAIAEAKEEKARKVKEAKEVAESCPEAVIDLGKKKACREE